jgi:hypothetical protein
MTTGLRRSARILAIWSLLIGLGASSLRPSLTLRCVTQILGTQRASKRFYSMVRHSSSTLEDATLTPGTTRILPFQKEGKRLPPRIIYCRDAPPVQLEHGFETLCRDSRDVTRWRHQQIQSSYLLSLPSMPSIMLAPLLAWP